MSTKTDELMRLMDICCECYAYYLSAATSRKLAAKREMEEADAALLSAIQELVRDSDRYRWLKLNGVTPGQRPVAEEMPLGYKPIRLRVDTAVYLPETWNADVDAAIDAAMQPEPPEAS